jgi:hypothetical protein
LALKEPSEDENDVEVEFDDHPMSAEINLSDPTTAVEEATDKVDAMHIDPHFDPHFGSNEVGELN